jgi:hypothetical protein
MSNNPPRQENVLQELLEQFLKLTQLQQKANALQQEFNTYALEQLGILRDVENGLKDAIDQLVSKVDQLIALFLPEPQQSVTVNFTDEEGNDMANTITLAPGKTAQATATRWDNSGAVPAKIPLLGTPVWATSDPTVATVDSSGLVTYVGPGTAQIQGKDTDGVAGVGTVTDSAAPPPPAQTVTIDLVAL